MSLLRWGGCLAAMLSVTMAASANENVPNVEVMYDHPVNLTCMTEDLNPDATSVQIMWLLPNGDLVKKTDNHDRVMLYEQGKHIMVKKVDNIDFGVYNCIIYTFGTQRYDIIRKGINLRGPFWGDLLEKYRMNIIVGSIAGVVVGVLMIGMCYIMNRSHSLDVDEAERVKSRDLWVSNTHGINNAAVELDDVEVYPKKSPINGDSPPPKYASEQSTEIATKL